MNRLAKAAHPLLTLVLTLTAACANGQSAGEAVRPPAGLDTALVRRELEARYAGNTAAFIAKDTAAVNRLRAPGYHTVTPDGRTHSFDEMRAYTVRLFEMVERFDSVTFRIDSLSLRGDTAVAVTFQRSSRLQHLPGTPDAERHRVVAAALQREQWVRSPSGWLLWRVDQVRDQGLWVDGVLRRRPGS